MVQRYKGNKWPEYVAFVYRFPYENKMRIKSFGHRKAGRPKDEAPIDWAEGDTFFFYFCRLNVINQFNFFKNEKNAKGNRHKYNKAIRSYFTRPREDLLSKDAIGELI